MIILILLLSLGLRIISLNQSLWLDEAIMVVHAQHNSFLSYLTHYGLSDFHPPLYMAILWIWIHLFGNSEITVRLPSVMSGLLTIWFLYKLVNNFISKEAGLLAALLLAINPLHIYYSQENRMYSLAALAAMMSFYYLFQIVKNQKGYHGYTISLLLLFGTDYVASLSLFSHIIIIFMLNKKIWKPYFLCIFIAGIAWCWWIPFLIQQIQIGVTTAKSLPGWSSVVGSAQLKALALTYVKFFIGRINYPDHKIYFGLFVPLGLLIAWLLQRGVKGGDKVMRTYLLCWIVIPIILAWLISFIIPIYSYFRLLFILPAVIALLAIGIYQLDGRLRKIVICVLVIIELSCAFCYLLFPQFQREDWRGAVKFLDGESPELVILENVDSFAPFTYYGGEQLSWQPGLLSVPATQDADIRPLLGNPQDVYLLQYLVDVTDPQRLIDHHLQQLGYTILKIDNFPGVGFIYHYQKK